MEDLFYEVFTDLPRQGPGDDESTQKAASMVLEIPKYPKILDVGCGTGGQTLELAKYFGGTIYAVDNHQPYLDSLYAEARLKGFGDIIKCINANMLEPDFINGKFDLIWAEGSIFVVGFKEGLYAFKKMLNPTGYIAVSEVCWLKDNPPDDLLEFWNREYPAIRDI
ncbi:MAG: class I SAM-dependent methyltransferase, partial [Bacteroidales bacterium]|nr:class I SAM-dependent methyltransferase [Bacteroidales bacterium]